ncbi:hypothetical protein D3C76_1331030 [compost metagenome]
MVADGEGFFLVMGDEDGAGAAALENVAHFVAEPAAQLHVEVGKGLVEQQQLRFGCQGARQGDALLLATGQFMRIALAQTVELDQLQHFVDHPGRLWMLADTECNVFGHGQVREQGVVLEHHADPAFLRGEGEARPGDDFASQLDFTLVDRLEAGDGAQGSGLAAPRRAQQAADVTGIEVKIEVLDHALVLVATGQVAQVKQ